MSAGLIDRHTRYYHGGTPGLRHIHPPEVTNAPSCASYGAAGVCRRDRVYVTTDQNAALLYAAMHPSGKGVVYEVTPHGALEPDPDCHQPGLSYACESASVMRAIKCGGKVLKRIRKVVLEDAYL